MAMVLKVPVSIPLMSSNLVLKEQQVLVLVWWVAIRLKCISKSVYYIKYFRTTKTITYWIPKNPFKVKKHCKMLCLRNLIAKRLSIQINVSRLKIFIKRNLPFAVRKHYLWYFLYLRKVNQFCMIDYMFQQQITISIFSYLNFNCIIMHAFVIALELH